MIFPEHNVKDYFRTAVERYQIFLRRQQGIEPPWTADPTFRKWRFCNVFREDDRTTRWITQNIREPLRDSPYVVFAMTACNIFNNPATLEPIRDMLLNGEWDPKEARKRLFGITPVVSGAYMVNTPRNKPKLDGVLSILTMAYEPFMEIPKQIYVGDETLQSLHSRLTIIPHIGGFTAYEIVSDLRHTWVAEQAADINTWAFAGPGCKTGLRMLLSRDNVPTTINIPRKLTLPLMRQLLEKSRNPEYWPKDWPVWEMREAEHWACEYAKYCKGAYWDVKLKRRFMNGKGY